MGSQLIGIILFLFTILIDQLSKQIVLKQVNRRSVRVWSMLRIQVTANRVNDKSRHRLVAQAVLLTLIVAFVVSLNILAHFFENDLTQAGLGAAVGGAVSNLFDRFWRRRVVDFIDFSFWPTFNFADVAIVFGLVFAITGELVLILQGTR